ncbi:hypothetical protein EYF80_065298 [Liparis tanakae]|uniref:Uncharacterized protein n=1 Tax=Liparis tanakae TaxID=230148 RepID=A0A4Z2E6M2_9TELE|nr:hypothetical protein EYF80_065298 [Liparis tanakae]
MKVMKVMISALTDQLLTLGSAQVP